MKDSNLTTGDPQLIHSLLTGHQEQNQKKKRGVFDDHQLVRKIGDGEIRGEVTYRRGGVT